MAEEHSFKSRELAPIESLARNASYSFVHVGIKQVNVVNQTEQGLVISR